MSRLHGSQECVSGFSTRSTPTWERLRGWHSGMRSDVRFAAMIPASLAVARTLPFALLPSRSAANAPSPRWTAAHDGSPGGDSFVRDVDQRRPAGCGINMAGAHRHRRRDSPATPGLAVAVAASAADAALIHHVSRVTDGSSSTPVTPPQAGRGLHTTHTHEK